VHGVEYKLAMGFIKSSGWGCVGLCLSFVTVESRRWRGGREGDESVVGKNDEKTENNAEQ
jgi:hypothetical protein